MGRYESLRGLAGAIATIGWIAVILGGIALVGSLMAFLGSSLGVFGFGALFVLIGGGQILLFGLLLAAAGGVINVLIDIETNTSGRMHESGAAPSAVISTSMTTTRAKQGAVPSDYEPVGQSNLVASEHVFDRAYGEGVVIGVGPKFAFVHFPNAELSPVEVEKGTLYRRAPG